jgi:hypothetical protein
MQQQRTWILGKYFISDYQIYKNIIDVEFLVTV